MRRRFGLMGRGLWWTLGAWVAAGCMGGVPEDGGGALVAVSLPEAETARLSKAADCDDLRALVRGMARTSSGEVGADSLQVPPSFSSASVEASADDVSMSRDATRLFVLHGGALHVFGIAPAPALSPLGEAVAIEGTARGMIAHDDSLVVFSTLHGSVLPEEAEPSAAKSGGTYTKITRLRVRPKGAVAEPLASKHDLDAQSPDDVAPDLEGLVAEPLGAEYFRGQYVGAQQAGGVVRVVLSVEGRLAAASENAELSAWLPPRYVPDDEGKLVPVAPRCASHYVPRSLTDGGITRILTFDAASAEAPIHETTVFGTSAASRVGASSLVLAQDDPEWPRGAAPGSGPPVEGVHGQRSVLHAFTLEGTRVQYDASGWVPGLVPVGTALDVQGGVLRVVTSGLVQTDPEPPENWASKPRNQAFTLETVDGHLTPVHASAPLGGEGQSVHAVLWQGARGHVATSGYLPDGLAIYRFARSTLTVVELGESREAEVLGEVDARGAVRQLQRLDADHLLGMGTYDVFGPSASAVDVGWQVFEARDRRAPRIRDGQDVLDRHALESGHPTPAFQLPTPTFRGDLGLLAVPRSHRASLGETPARGERSQEYRSSLRLYRFDAQEGPLLDLGAIDHDAWFEDCQDEGGDALVFSCGYRPEVRRGLFAAHDDEAFVYTVSAGGITVHSVENLEDALAAVRLPAPTGQAVAP